MGEDISGQEEGAWAQNRSNGGAGCGSAGWFPAQAMVLGLRGFVTAKSWMQMNRKKEREIGEGKEISSLPVFNLHQNHTRYSVVLACRWQHKLDCIPNHLFRNLLNLC